MAASNYSVNIKLNTRDARVQLEALERRVNKLRASLNNPLRIESKATLIKKQQLALEDKKFSMMHRTRRLGDQIRRFEEQGLKLDRLKLEIMNAARHTEKGRFQTAKDAQKFVAEELKAVEKQLQANIKNAGVDRDRVRTLAQLVGLKRTEASLNRTAGNTAAFMDSQRRGIGPNNLLGLPSSKMLNARDRGIQVLDPLSRAGSTGFTAAQYGPQLPSASQIKALGTGPVGMDINSRFAQQRKRLKFGHELNMLELKGVKTTKLRAKMGELVDAQNRKDFGSIQRINNSLETGITKLKNRLKITNEIQKKQNQIASGKFAKGNNFGQAGGSIGPALPPSMQGGKFGFQSALISGAFPLLFGQGPLVGAAGFLGGGFGEKFGGQMGGFAGGLVATAAATAVQQFATETSKLGQALNDTTKDIGAVSAALGITGTEFEKNLKTLEKLGGEEAAFEAARSKMIDLVGQDGVNALQKFGEQATQLGNEFTKSMTMMKSSLAEFVGSLGIFQRLVESVTNLNLRAQAGESDDPRVKALLQELKVAEGLAASELRLGMKPGTLNKGRPVGEISEELLELQKSINLENEKKAINKLLGRTQEQRVKKIQEEIQLLERSFGMSSEEFEIEKQIAEMKQEGGVQDETEIRNKLKYLQSLQKERQLAEETAAAFERMSQTIATDISQGIQGMIRGTSTLSDLLNNVSDKLIDAAFNMAFFGNPQGKLGGGGLFGSILGGLFSGGGLKDVKTPILPTPIYTAANGGRIPGRRPSLVGEQGPELFTPATGGYVTPNHGLGGSTNVVVNVDASGSNVEGDEQQSREFGRLISAAVQSEIANQQRPGGLLFR